jgi:serine/threonine-protein kinase
VSSLRPGDVVDRYRVEELIGAGAMGEVYRAADAGLGRKVAVKILAEHHKDNDELRARFVREARAIAAVTHPNVVQVFLTGEHRGLPFLAMEHLVGRDLGGIVRSEGALSSAEAARAIRDAAQGLEAAAAAGLVHRDVKPSNLMRIDGTGMVKVADFGLAKPQLPGGDPALTAAGVVVGTPDYIAPEQARGEEIDARVDVYALGCSLFYLLTGRPPYRKGNESEDKYLKVVARHLRDPVPDARAEAPGVDDELAELAERASQIAARLASAKRRESGQAPRAPTTPPRPVPVAPVASESEVLRRAIQKARQAPAPDPSEGSVGELLAQQPFPRWLILFSLLAAGVLAAGLTARRWIGRPLVVSAAPAEPAETPAVPPAQPPPVAPAGMLLVSDSRGRPAFFVARHAVTHRELQRRVRGHKFKAEEADRPAVGVSWEEATSYATSEGARLLRPDEWALALDTPGFVPPGMKLVEWIADGPGAVRGVRDSGEHKSPKGDGSTTFRLARDL